MSIGSARVRGVCPVIETPFTHDGAVDFESLEAVTRHAVAAGARQALSPAFASEYYKLSDVERAQVASTVVDAVHSMDGTVAVVSVPDHATRLAVENARRAVDMGADMVNILPPHLQQPSTAAVIAHVKAVLAAIGDTPAILQYAPAQTGSTLTPQSIAQIAAECPNLVQVKVESMPPGRFISALAAVAPQLESIVGYAGLQLIDARRRGAVAVQPGVSFVELYLQLWSQWDDGDRDGAIALHSRMVPYLSYWMQSVELIIAAEKRISARRGIIATEVCRAPAHALDTEELAMIDRFLEEFADTLL